MIGRLIRWQTRSPYSHASIVFEGGRVIESREFIGVRQLASLQPQPGERIDLYRVPLTGDQCEAIRAFLYAQLGKPYDYTSVLRFISRRKASRESGHRWFCSELVFAAFHHAGVRLLDRVEPWAVSPGLLSLSPLLVPARVK
ncbi:MAG: hypothetical protein AB1705_21495 [Verrucomicrobiota bacterium]